jgi:hypothetical protein
MRNAYQPAPAITLPQVALAIRQPPDTKVFLLLFLQKNGTLFVLF